MSHMTAGKFIEALQDAIASPESTITHDTPIAFIKGTIDEHEKLLPHRVAAVQTSDGMQYMLVSFLSANNLDTVVEELVDRILQGGADNG